MRPQLVARRVIGKAEWTGGEANPRLIVTSLRKAGTNDRFLYEKVYCARGEMENRIKECQGDLFADHTSTATMRANQLPLVRLVRLWRIDKRVAGSALCRTVAQASGANFRAPALVDDASERAGEVLPRVGLADEPHAGIEPSVVDHGVAGVAGREQRRHVGAKPAALVGGLRPLRPPGSTTSVKRRSTRAGPARMSSASLPSRAVSAAYPRSSSAPRAKSRTASSSSTTRMTSPVFAASDFASGGASVAGAVAIVAAAVMRGR